VRTLLLLPAIAASLLTFGCGESCGPPGASCSSPPIYDLVLTEADSGKAGVSAGYGQGVAFLLDGRRARLVTTPVLPVKAVDDPYKQFPGRHAFAIWTSTLGVFDVTATGAGIPPFTFHLVIGRGISPTFTVLSLGDVVIQEYASATGPPVSPAFGSPLFELVQEPVTVGSTGRLLLNTPTQTRRAYRAAHLGTQIYTSSATGDAYRVVVANAPSDFGFVDGDAPVPPPVGTSPGVRFAIVLAGDGQRVSWSAQPDYAVTRLPDAAAGPQPPGVTLVPFMAMAEGKTSLEIRQASRTFTLTLGENSGSCLPDDFPRYPLARPVDIRGPGQCNEDMSLPDPPAEVLAFYRLHLNEGDWRIVSEHASEIKYVRRSDPAFSGSVKVDRNGIYVQMNRA
jgi:hypothetical protein